MEIFINLLTGLWRYISPKTKWQAKILIVLMILSAFVELVSIGAILPILAFLVAEDSNNFLSLISSHIDFSYFKAREFQVFVIIFVILAIIAMLVRLVTLRLSTELVAQISTQISGQVFFKTLCQPYMVHISRNSSEILDVITNKMGYVSNFTTSVFALISTCTMFIFLVSGMFVIDFKTTLLGLSIFGAFYIGVNIFFKKKLIIESALISKETGLLTKLVQESLSAVRDIELDKSHKIFHQKYIESDISFRNSLANIQYISLVPRYVIETLALVFFIIIAYLFVIIDKKDVVLITFGPLIIITQKLIPAIQQAYAALINIKGCSSSLNEILNLLAQSVADDRENIKFQEINFESEIVLDEIWFSYFEGGPWRAEAISLKIPCGSCIGFIGQTGSGKSTIIDIVMGLLRPTKGKIYVDDKEINNDNLASWQACISHVPQSIYIFDSSVLENIALGVPIEKIDKELVIWAAKIAQIHDVIQSLPLKYDTRLGERGIRISGGQLQRVGVARALYKQSKVLILDEATSALDEKTEERLINAIRNSVDNQGLKKTVLMVAHRLSTLKHCDYLVEIKAGKIISIDSYENFINRKNV